MSDNRRYYNNQKRKSRIRKRVLIWVLLPIMLLALSATAYGAYLYNKASSAIEDSYKPIKRETNRASAAKPEVDNISLLIIGVDDSSERGFSNSARSDALLVATFNKTSKSIKLLSIPRDSYVHIPKLGYEDKITHAHAHGGPLTTIETVENLLDIPIDYYVKLNFNAFIDIVDALDGIEVDVPFKFSEQNSSDVANAITLLPGEQILDGEEALALARTRKLDNDIERGKRQQEILKAIIKRSLSAGSITKYGDVIDAVGNNMETDLSFEQMKSFMDYVSGGTSLNIDNLNLAGADMYLPNSSGINVYYYQLNEEKLEEVKTEMKNHLNSNTINTEKNTIDDPDQENGQTDSEDSQN
ncbi:LCP family protein [Cytobacillus gottheilii]|uniref:LCP family protein n=1 Tax=Cytobacillus gottheilii TaxID=859144 RepID=UPI0009B984C9|nr:LCP family protein [Cytobacillus gottheilii]